MEPGIVLISSKNRDLWTVPKLDLFIILLAANTKRYSTNALKIRSGQWLQFLILTKMIAACGDEDKPLADQ